MTRRYKANKSSWGAIRKLNSGRYQASYPAPDGKRYNAESTFDIRADAEMWLSDRRREIQRGEWVDPETKSTLAAEAVKVQLAEVFGTYARTWVAQRVSSKGQPLRPKTRAEYERQLRKGLSEFENDRLSSITPARVREWHARRMLAGETAAGAEARLLRAILNTAVGDGILARNPVGTNLTRTSSGIKHRPPTLEELSTLLETIDPAFRLAVLLAAYGGLRLSEWRALRRRDISLSPLSVNVERAAPYVAGRGWRVGPPKSSEGVRTVTLPSALTSDFERHLAERVGEFPDSLVFQPKGRSEFVHDRQFNDAWNVARDAAGLRVDIKDPETGKVVRHESVVREHDLRAFAGTMHAQTGATLRETMAYLGHSTTTAAMAYQATTGRDAELAEKMPLPRPGAASNVSQLVVSVPSRKTS